MKKFLLMAGVATFTFASNASALEVNPYISAKLSYNWAKNDVKTDVRDSYDGNYSDKTKFHKNIWGGHLAAGAKAGAFRSEIEWNQWQDAKRTQFYDGGKYRMRLQNNALLLNAYYDFNTCTPWTPYVGAGLGVAMLKYTINDMWEGNKDKFSERTYNFAWQIGAGVAYDLTKNIALDAGYRYINAGSAVARKYIYSGNGYYSEKHKINTANHEIYFGARYTF